MKLLILDNYDSFTYNLVHLVEKVSSIRFDVFQNDAITVQEAAEYDKILLSPGPGLPSAAGIMPQLLKQLPHSRSVLGVCLGLQGIIEHFGGRLRNLKTVKHGVATPVSVIREDKLLNGIPRTFLAGRYHSWAADPDRLPPDLLVTAVDEEGEIMAVRHKTLDVCGVQFHPESILSEYGEELMANWLNE